VRRAGSVAAPAQEEAEAISAEGQAQALYDYSGAVSRVLEIGWHALSVQDAGDLTIQAGQIVNVLEKTSDDCK
jgi:hypothetical protein